MTEMIEKMGTHRNPKGYQTHYRLWVNDKVEVLFHQSNRLWIVTYTSKSLSQKRFKSLDALKAEFKKVFGVN